MVAIANQWKAIGVETSFINTDAKTHFAYLRDGGDFDVARAGWIADYSDPQNFLFLVQSDNPGFNYAKYKNPEYDALMRKSGEEKDLQKRAAILLEAEKIFMRDVPTSRSCSTRTRTSSPRSSKAGCRTCEGANATRFLSLKP